MVRSAVHTAVQVTPPFALVYHPEDGNVLLSGSTNRISVWDIRTEKEVRSVIGPHLRGSGMDVHQNSVFAASWRDQKQISVWDFPSMRKVKEFAFDPPGGRMSQLNTLSVSRNGIALFAGGSGTNVAQAFDTQRRVGIGMTKPASSAIWQSAISAYGSACYFGTESGVVQCHTIRMRPIPQ
jgi:WD40 repeat protein